MKYSIRDTGKHFVIGIYMKEIAIDYQDRDLFDIYSWSFDSNKNKFSTTYQGKKLYLNRVIGERMYTLSSSDRVIYKDKNSLNNRRCNISVATYSEVKLRDKSNNHYYVGTRGVHRDRTGDGYIANITIEGERQREYFSSEEDAIQWRLSQEKNL